jgi:iron complex outermembrane receptor protein
MINYTSSTLALAAAFLSGTAAAAAQTNPEASAQTASVVETAPQEGGSDIVILGTRRTDRTLADSASPVDVISSAELAAQPSANMLDTLKSIVPSFYVGQNSISDASTFVRSPSLRGLPADQVLVMINGKRYNRSALVQVYGGSDTGLGRGSQGADISAIPSLAIGSLQILREGATAQYGSDAIAGVLNYGLKEVSGLEMVARYGEYYAGDGKSYQIAANAGVALGKIGFINVTGEYNDDGQTSRGAQRPSAANYAINNPGSASQLPNYPLPAQIWGSSPSHGYKFVVNSAIDVTSDSKLYFFGNFARSKADQSFNYRASVTSTAVDTDGVTRTQSANALFNNTFFLTACPTGSATCPAGGFVRDGNTFRYSSLYPAGFTPRFVGVTKELYGTLGYKGEIAGGLKYDLSGSLSRNTLTLSMYDSLNASYGPQTQTSFTFGELIQEEADANLDLSYPLEVGLPSPLTIAGGAEFRKETYEQTVGDLQSYAAGPYSVAQQLYTQTAPGVYSFSGTSSAQGVGASGYAGTSPEAAGRYSQKSYGAYINVETDLTTALSVGAAGRYEHYDSFGGAVVGKFNAIYKFADAFSLRGTVGTGFHAPSPGQSNNAIITTAFVGGNAVQSGTYPVSTAIAQYFGADALKPEKSTNYGIGFILNPVNNLTLTVDGYSISVRNRIGITQNFIVSAADLAAQPALLAVGVNGQVNYFTNGFNTRTRGVDVVGTYRTTLDEAAVNLTLAYNYNKSIVTKYDPQVIGPNQILDAEHLAPNHRVVFTTNWSLDGVSINVRENYYSWWLSAQDYVSTSNPVAQRFGGKFTTDLDVSYTFAKNYTLTLGAQNLLDERPDKLSSKSTPIYPLTGGSSDGQVYARNGGPFGFNGGLYYARLRVKY